MSLWSGALQSLLLGLSTGTYCAMYCAPVLLPLVAGTDNISEKKTTVLTSLFLSGRMITYIVLGIICAAAGLLVSSFFDPVIARRLSVIAYIICGAVLLSNSLQKMKKTDEASCKGLKKIPAFTGNDYSTAVLCGLAAGLHICPPYWATLFLCSQSGSAFSAAVYFIFFFAGTLPFFIPVFALPFTVKKLPALRKIAQITQLLIAVYFIVFAGIIPLFFYK